MIMYGVAAQLLIVAIVCYAAFPVTPPEEPLRLIYQTNAGKVLFDHQAHATTKGSALACMDCHHAHGGEEIEPVSCGLCHPPRRAGSQFPEFCMDCHSDISEIENPETVNRADALHQQCTQCHEGFGKGPLHSNFVGNELKERPTDWVNCNKCHVL